MSAEHRDIPPAASSNPEDILRVKDEVLSRWEQLPPEHQVTMALLLLDRIPEEAYRSWVRDALAMLPGGLPLEDAAASVRQKPPEQEPHFTIPFEITTMCREDLREVLSEAEVAQFDDEDMRRLAIKMADAYVGSGVFWDDLEFLGRRILEEKRGQP